MKKTTSVLALVLLSYVMYAEDKKPEVQQDTTKRQPIASELPRDTTTYRAPVQRLDTMKNNMPSAQPGTPITK